MESGSGGGGGGGGLKGKGRPQEQLNCPRCKSSNTKFCYYNNYSLTQPRYFCKSCRRYWTEGGSLRNIPVGGGSRKNRKPPGPVVGGSGSAHHAPPLPQVYQAHDLNLGFATAEATATTMGMENGGHGGFGCYIPNLMPYSARDTAAVEENSGNNGYWNGMFGGGPPW